MNEDHPALHVGACKAPTVCFFLEEPCTIVQIRLAHTDVLVRGQSERLFSNEGVCTLFKKNLLNTAVVDILGFGREKKITQTL